MVKIKKSIIILICAFFVFFLFYAVKVLKTSAGTLSCSVTTSCPSGVVIWRMSGTSNAHAELPSQSNYSQLVCCSGVPGLSNSCTGTFATVLKLSRTTNAHVEQNTQTNYTHNVCISVPAGGSVSVGYQANNCIGYDTTLGSMSGPTNAHVGDSTAYTTKICATAAVGFLPAIEIRAQNYTTPVSTITFPPGLPGSTVSQPYNNVDGSGSPQTFGGAGIAKPVVTLYNGSLFSLRIWYHITTFTNNIVSNEYYLINNKGAACNNADAINNVVTFDVDTPTDTIIAPGPGNEKDFYLKIILSSVAGKTGSSTLTILGELL